MAPDPTKPLDARFAAWLVRPWCATALQPNHLTTIRLLTGLAGAVLFASGGHDNLAAWMIVLSNFLDHTDGEFARMTGRHSRFGHNYDLVADAAVTLGMFIGIGVGLDASVLGGAGPMLGIAAGAMVAAIFHLRYQLEKSFGKSAIEQKRFGAFETEDVLYLVPVVTLADGLRVFLALAAITTPFVLLLVAWQYRAMARVAERAG